MQALLQEDSAKGAGVRMILPPTNYESLSWVESIVEKKDLQQ